MENVLAVIELTGELFKCGVIAGVGFYILHRYRAHREATVVRRAYNRTILRTTKKGLPEEYKVKNMSIRE